MKLKSLISDQIRNVLLERNSVVVPGLGVFFLTSFPARIDLKEEKIYPPGKSIEFLEAPNVSDYFLAYILAESYRGDFSFWNKEIDAFTSDFQNLEKGESLELGKLGRLVQGDRMEFRPSEESPLLLFNTLPELHCKPVPRSLEKPENKVVAAETPAVVNIPNINQTEERKENKTASSGRKRTWGIVGAAAAVLLLLIGFFVVEGLGDNGPILEIPTHVYEDRLNQPPEKLYVDTFHQEHEEETDEAEESEWHLSPDLPENEEDEAALNEGEEMEMEPESREIPREDSLPDEAHNGECVIITGAFGSRANINLMKSQLEEMGYTLFEEPIGELMRVGVKVSCSENDLEYHLQLLRSQVESNSWIKDQ